MVAISQESTGVSFFENADGKFIHFRFPSDTGAFDTDRPSTIYDDSFWWPINVLISMNVYIPEIFSCPIQLVVIKVP